MANGDWREKEYAQELGLGAIGKERSLPRKEECRRMAIGEKRKMLQSGAGGSVKVKWRLARKAMSKNVYWRGIPYTCE